MTVDQLIGILAGIVVLIVIGVMAWKIFAGVKRDKKNYARALKMVPMLIHLPPSTDDVQVGGRDERDVIGEQLSEAQVMYSIISSTTQPTSTSSLSPPSPTRRQRVPTAAASRSSPSVATAMA